MIILSKANLVDEGIDLDEIKNSIKEDSIVVGGDNEDGFSELLEDLQKKHKRIQRVFNKLLIMLILNIFNRIIQPPSPTFVKPSLTN